MDADAAEAPYDFESKLSQIEVPVLAVAGSGDRVAPPRAVFAAAQRMRSMARFHEVGVGSGARVDYGHIDLLLGRHSSEEVFPVLMEFMSGHD